MYNVSVIITEEGRPALQLSENENRYHSDKDVTDAEFRSGLRNEFSPVIIIDMCGTDVLYNHMCVIKD